MDVSHVEQDLVNVLFTEKQIQDRLGELAREIEADYEGQDLLIVGILRGAVMVMADLARSLSRHARSINPAIEIGAELEQATVCLGVGDTAAAAAVPTIYLGSDGWVARLSSTEPVGSGRTTNPFGAGAAACFGAAELGQFFLPARVPDPTDVLLGIGGSYAGVLIGSWLAERPR